MQHNCPIDGRCLRCNGQGYLNNLSTRQKDTCQVCYGTGGKVPSEQDRKAQADKVAKKLLGVTWRDEPCKQCGHSKEWHSLSRQQYVPTHSGCLQRKIRGQTCGCEEFLGEWEGKTGSGAVSFPQ